MPVALLLIWFSTGCAQRLPADVVASQKLNQHTPKNADQIVLSVTLFILDDHEQVFSSQRTAEEVLDIQDHVNEIWQQANIYFVVEEVRRVVVPIDITANVIRREIDQFFQTIATEGDVFQTGSHISGFYVQTLKGDNGLHPVGYPAFFAADDTLNDPERVVAHELGHILGLKHTVNRPERLMQSGANGINLTDGEILLARQNASKLK